MKNITKILGFSTFAIILCAAGVFGSTNSTQAHGNTDGHVVTTNVVNKKLRTDIDKANKDLNADLASYTKAQNKSAALSKLVATAKSRKAKMLEQARTNPKDFLTELVPASTYNKLPKEVQDQTEKGIKVRGRLKVYHFEGLDGKALPNRYEIKEENTNKVYDLHFASGEIPLEQNGTMVVANAVALDSSLIVSSAENQALGTGITYEQSVPNIGSTTGPQKFLVMLVGLTDTPQNRPYTQSEMNNLFFGPTNSVTSYYNESSYGQVSVVGDVTPWLDIPYATQDCVNATTTTAAISAAAAAGYNLNNYSRYIFVFPLISDGTCPVAGGASGNTILLNSVVYNNSHSSFLAMAAHEVGHSFDIDVLGHSSTLTCGSKVIDLISNCSIREYGDFTDVMGNNNYGIFPFTAAHRAQLNWIPSSRILTVTTSGTYTINPVENQTGIQLLQISKPELNGSYYFEYRQPLNSDSTLPSGIYNGAGIMVGPTNGNGVSRLDMTPGDTDSYTGGNDYKNSTMKDNDVFTDTVLGITVKQLSHNSAGVTLQVTFTSSACKVNPTVTASPSTQDGSISQYLTYNVTVKNNDNSGCLPANFNLDVNDVGIQKGLKIESVVQTGVLQPGASQTQVVRVAATSSTNTGNLNFAFTAKDLVDPSHTASSSQVTYNVIANCVRSRPTITIANPALSGNRGDKVTYNVTVKNNDYNCPSSIFKVYGYGGGQTWVYSDPSYAQLASGASATVQVSATSPMDAVATTNLGINAVDSDVTLHTVTTTVTYTITGLPCTRAPSTMTIANANQTGFAGQPLTYAVTVSNHDSVGCEPVRQKFEIVGLSGGLTAPYLGFDTALTSGTSFTAQQTVYSSTSSANQTYPFTIYLTDAASGTRITSVQASFTVVGGVNTCVRTAPTVTLNSPAQTGVAGSQQSYTGTIVNKDSNSCASSVFNLSVSAPTGFNSNVTPSTITMASGGTSTFTATVTSPSSASNGPNSFTVIANDLSINGHSGSASGTYTVSNPVCTRVAPTMTLTPSINTGLSGTPLTYTANVYNNDNQNCASSNFNVTVSVPAGVTSTVDVPSFSLAPGNFKTVTVTIVPKTTDQLTVTATDAATPNHNASATADFAVYIPTCVRKAPLITLSPGSQTSPAGAALLYTATIYNNDGDTCANTTFNISTNLPTGFTSSASLTSFSLAPGNFRIVSISVISPSTASNGDNSFTVTASDNNLANHSDSANSIYKVSNPVPTCTRNAPTVSVSPSTQTGVAGQTFTSAVTLKNNDSSGCASSSFFVMPLGPSNGSTTTTTIAPGVTQTFNLSYTPSSNTFNGTYTVVMNVTDSAVGSIHNGSDSVTYTISNPTPTCTRNAPTVTVNPTSNTGAAGSKQTYALNIKNNDSSNCANAGFKFSVSGLPTGFSYSGGNISSQSIAPGSSATVNFPVTSPSTAANGNYYFNINAVDPNNSIHNVSSMVAYVVSNPVTTVCTRNAPTVTASPSSQTGVAGQTFTTSVTLKNNDSSGCASSSFFAMPLGPSNGSTTTTTIAPGATQTFNLSYTPSSSTPNGTYTVVMNVTDSAVGSIHNGSDSVTYTISNPVSICTRNAPTVTASPSSQTGVAGQSFNVSVTLKNNDSSGCASSSFFVMPLGPSNGTTTTTSVAPGSSKTFTLSFTASNSAANGTYTVMVSATDSSVGSAHNGSDSVTYTISTPTPTCTRNTPTVTASPSSQTGVAGQSFSLSVTLKNNDSNSCASSYFFVMPQGPSNGTTTTTSVAPGSTKTFNLSFTPSSSTANGTYTVMVSATDSSVGSIHNGSDSVTYTINAPTPTCTRNAPTVTASPSSQTGVAGQTFTTSVTLKNNDSSGCASSSFFAMPLGPSNGSTTTTTIAPGATQTFNLSYTPSSSTPNGTYTVVMNVTDSAVGSIHNGSDSVTYTISNPGSVQGDFTNTPSAQTDPNTPHAPGTLIKIDSTYYIAMQGGLIGIPSMEVLQSWGYSINNAVQGNAADELLFQFKVLTMKQPGESTPW